MTYEQNEPHGCGCTHCESFEPSFGRPLRRAESEFIHLAAAMARQLELGADMDDLDRLADMDELERLAEELFGTGCP